MSGGALSTAIARTSRRTMARAPIIRRAVAVILALGVLAALLALEAQQAEKVWRIGVFHVGDHIPPGLQTLRDGLKALGYEAGKNLQLDFRNLADEEAASRTASEFVQSRPNLIVMFGNPAARAARAVTSEIPIVMVNVADPVAQGLVMSLAAPAGTLRASSSSRSPCQARRALQRDGPTASAGTRPGRPSRSWDASAAGGDSGAARILKLKLTEREATGQADLERIFRSINQGDVDGVVSASINLQIKFTTLLIRLVTAKRLPLATYRKESVQDGRFSPMLPTSLRSGGAPRRS